MSAASITTTKKMPNQQKLVDKIRQLLHPGSTKLLKPLCAHSRFGVPQLWDYWVDPRVLDLAWTATARVMARATPDRHVIDHAWLFGVDDAETWGFVTEPYLDADGAEAAAKATLEVVEDWGIAVHCLDASQSSWNVGYCPPIVVTFVPDCMRTAVRRALQYLIAEEVL